MVGILELTFPSKSDTFSFATALVGVLAFNPAEGGPLPDALLPVVTLGLGAVLAVTSDARGLTVAVEGVGEVTVGAFLARAAVDSFCTVLLVVAEVVGFVAVDAARGLVGAFAAVEPPALGAREARLEAVVVLVLKEDLSVVGTRLPPTAEDAPEGGSLVLELFVLPKVDPLAGAFEELGLIGAFVPAAEADGLAELPLVPNVPEVSTCK
jgi:hypothetical protein